LCSNEGEQEEIARCVDDDHQVVERDQEDHPEGREERESWEKENNNYAWILELDRSIELIIPNENLSQKSVPIFMCEIHFLGYTLRMFVSIHVQETKT
jgi:hypothetical protein